MTPPLLEKACLFSSFAPNSSFSLQLNFLKGLFASSHSLPQSIIVQCPICLLHHHLDTSSQDHKALTAKARDLFSACSTDLPVAFGTVDHPLPFETQVRSCPYCLKQKQNETKTPNSFTCSVLCATPWHVFQIFQELSSSSSRLLLQTPT